MIGQRRPRRPSVREEQPHLRGRVVELRLVTPDDVPALVELFAQPSVRAWWRAHDEERVREEILDVPPEGASFAIEVGGALVGLIQCWEDDNPDYRHASMDIALRPELQGRGIGPDALRTLARYLFGRGHHRLTIDPALANEGAIRAYRRVGFEPVGVMRRYERGEDGTWHDGLLMDLLAEEMTEE
jgi:aminoglycoside 6'-N-acetyltransferase